MRTYLIETYMPRDRPEVWRDAALRLRRATEALAADGHAVLYLQTAFLSDDELCLHTLQADSAGTAGEATKRAGITSERVIETLPVHSGGHT